MASTSIWRSLAFEHQQFISSSKVGHEHQGACAAGVITTRDFVELRQRRRSRQNKHQRCTRSINAQNEIRNSCTALRIYSVSGYKFLEFLTRSGAPLATGIWPILGHDWLLGPDYWRDSRFIPTRGKPAFVNRLTKCLEEMPFQCGRRFLQDLWVDLVCSKRAEGVCLVQELSTIFILDGKSFFLV
ncbi:hypothetical protein T265_09544 [Opisthorchis viverrini]|uniref:Uncharacterized protein n=1 Tax=Opisthorchis viverrini TaxID=6198 RepID=A0A075A4K9_OPIVI|nr:hypothetical protein T265_09544 [Opisthorchis viverrini]KER22349.1 hypothetical protein T265_09544 [Opisthorchis viverrini]